eukprot:43342_1
MYYATDLFIKKGALGKIWLAGTLWKKLTRKQILESDIGELCRQVSEPPIPLAISTSGKLTFGIVKIYDFKVGVVLKTANESYAKLIRFIKKVERTKINLPNAQMQANMDQITIQQRLQPQIDDIGDIDLRDTALIQPIRIPTEIAEDLIAPDSAITMQPVRDTSTMRVIPRGLEIADDELSIDFGLDLDIGDDEDLSEEAAKQMDDLQISMEPELPEPSGSSLSGEPIPALKDMSVSIEPEIPIIEPIEPEIEIPMEDMTIPQIEEILSVHSSDTISPRRMSVPVPIDREEVVSESEKDIDIDMEDITQRRDRRKKVKRKKKKKIRFNKDDVIELEDADRLIDLNNTQDVREYTIERPHFSHIDNRPLREGEFEELFTRSLSGIYANNALTDAFKEFTM